MSQSRTRVRSVTVRRRAQAARPRPAQEQAARTRNGPAEQAGRQPTTKDETLTKPLGFGERMLRNTAVCVALLLCVLATQSADPNGASLLSQVVTMDLSESLGSLRFVSNLVPESAAVFWNLGVEHHALPSQAEVAHVFSASEPWTAYGEGAAQASAPGEVMSVGIAADGLATVRLRHAGGMETLYGGLSAVSVREGDWVETGQTLGEGETLLFELRLEGRAVDPAGYWR